MAYALRYYKEMIQADGSTIRLEIHKKDSTAEAVEIGAVIQCLSLEIQGSQGDVDSPIVKTSLLMTFVDASDIENGQKNGFWEEFYTPDALLWKVVLMAKDAQETAFRTIWGGYVTPDSFSEDLVYRGSVSIIARDNVGHMQDFPFDAEGDADGLISLRNLVSMAWEKIASPMDLIWNENQVMICEGVPAYETMMNVSQFEGKNWYIAVESALASYGMVMRYIGDNMVHVGALRYLPNLGYVDAGSVPHLEPVFITGAQRELVPAVRRIEESVDYDVTESMSAPQVQSSDFTGEMDSIVLSTSSGVQFTLEGWYIKNEEEGEGWVNNSVSVPPYFYPSGYDLSGISEDSHDPDFMWFAFSQYFTGDNRFALYSRRMMSQAVSMRMAFGPAYRLVDGVLTPLGGARADYAMIAVEVVHDGNSFFLQEDGSWGDTLELLTYNKEKVSNGEIVVDLPTGEFDGGIILNIRVYEAGYYSWAQDTYVPLYSLDFSANNVVLEKNTVNTVYNADNNVILSRSPEIGPAYDSVALPAFIKNGIFVRSGDEILPARNWGWSGGSVQQMAVWNHLQLLCYYAKPNNQISGSIVNADMTRVQTIYEWHGTEHMLVSGRYNFLRGQIESAVLREFARYEDMWSEVAGAAMPDTEEDSTTNVEGSASSGGSSSTYTNTTTVNIGSGGSGGGASYLNDLLDVNVDSVLAQSVLYYNGTEWVSRSLAALHQGYATDDDLLTLSNLLASMWSIDADGNLVTDKQVLIKNNLIVEGDTKSGGEGEDTAAIGTVTGIMVNGTTYNPTAGIVTIPDYPTSLEWNAISGKPSFATVATSGSYDDLSNKPTSLPASDVYAWAKASTKPSYGWTEITGKPTTLAGYGITDAYTKDEITTKLGDYLLKSGVQTHTGTLTLDGLESNALIVANSTKESNVYARYDGKGTVLGYLGFETLSKPSFMTYNGEKYELWHKGNLTKLSQLTDDVVSGKYLPLTGGTISGQLNVTNINGYTPITSGNIGSQSVNYATSAGSASKATSDHLGNNIASTYSTKEALNAKDTFDMLYAETVMANVVNAETIYGELVGNAATATKLATARTIWGQSFDGTGNVSGDIYLGTAQLRVSDASSSYDIAYLSSTYGLYIGDGTSSTYNTSLLGQNINLVTGTNGQIRLYVKNDGNVGIGTTNPQVKLDVNGVAKFKSITDTASISDYDNQTGYFVGKRNDGLGVTTGGLLLSAYGTTPISLHAGGAERIHITAGGNVGIGTTNPQVKLDVNGGVYAVEYSSFLNNKRWIFGAGVITGNENHFVFSDNASYEAHVLIDCVNSRVGIGTSSPEYKLDVSGTGRFTDALTLGSTLSVASTSTFTGKTTHNGGIGATSGAFSTTLAVTGATTIGGALTVGAGVTITGNSTINGNLVVIGDVASA